MFRASFKYVSYEVKGLTISNDAVYVSLGGHWAMFVCIVFHYSLYCLVGFQFVLIRFKCISAGFDLAGLHIQQGVLPRCFL